jgi:hypothetical protein
VRPFVTAFIPVIARNGAVGGVLVDSGGVVARAEVAELDRLRKAWEAAIDPVTADLGRPSPLRKISLRRLEEAIAARLAEKRPLDDAMNCLAGLHEVRYVFVYPDQGDIVLAGPAEAWRITQHGALAGANTGRPVLMLEDLLTALRCSETAAASGILCSIDPTDEGLVRLRRALRSRPVAGPALLRQLEQTLGPQVITVEGVPDESRFARVMVAADFLMKRIGMGFEPAPVPGLPSYLEMAAAASVSPRTMTPRWWLAPKYAPLRRDGEGLAWEIGERSIQTLSDEGDGPTRGASLTRQWAEGFTAKYDELSRELPAFAELQNCIDLAVVAALVERHDLRRVSGFPMKLLLDPERLPTGAYDAPHTAPSLANAVPKGNTWIVSVSGGVEADPQQIASTSELAAQLSTARTHAAPPAEPRWWWD